MTNENSSMEEIGVRTATDPGTDRIPKTMNDLSVIKRILSEETGGRIHALMQRLSPVLRPTPKSKEEPDDKDAPSLHCPLYTDIMEIFQMVGMVNQALDSLIEDIDL